MNVDELVQVCSEAVCVALIPYRAQINREWRKEHANPKQKKQQTLNFDSYLLKGTPIMIPEDRDTDSKDADDEPLAATLISTRSAPNTCSSSQGEAKPKTLVAVDSPAEAERYIREGLKTTAKQLQEENALECALIDWEEKTKGKNTRTVKVRS